MRKQLTALIGAAAGLAALAASAGPAAAWHNYRWYADYAPLYRPCCGAVYGPPVVYVVPPAYAYYPRPLYRAGCCGTIYGPAGTYYPRAVYYPRAAYYTYGYVGYPYPYRRGCCW